MGDLEEALHVTHTALMVTREGHPDQAGRLNNLGLLYSNQGKLTEAEEMYRRALEEEEKALSIDHISTLATVNKLGNLYIIQGKLIEAEEMFQRALVGNEKVLGPSHSSTLEIAQTLGSFYEQLNKLDDAERLFRRAMIGYQRSLGLRHSNTRDALDLLNHIRTLQHSGEEDSVTSIKSNISSTDSTPETASIVLSSATSRSGPVMRPKPDIIVAEPIRFLAEDTSIRTISLKALERSKYELKFDRLKIERKFGRLLHSYSIGLRSSPGHHSEIYATKLLRKHSGLVAAGVFRTILLDIDLQLKMANLVNQPAEN